MDKKEKRPIPDAIMQCPITPFLAVIGGKWKVLVLFHIANNKGRFGLLQRQIPGISKQMLTAQLREMETDGIIHRQVFAEVPLRVEYTVTPKGLSLFPILEALKEWGVKHSEAGG